MNAVLALFASLALPRFTDAAKPAPASIIGRSFGLFEDGGEFGAAGPGYSARFTGQSFELTPVLGARAPKDTPVAFSLESIRLGESVVHEAGACSTPVREGNRLRIARGAGVTESYEARREGVEISYLFESRPVGAGDLVVRGRLSTELPLAAAKPGDDGIRFEIPGLGGVNWGGVTGIDAHGAISRGTVRFDGTHLEMSLPGEFVERATFPLLLDPLVGSTIVFSGGNDRKPDVAYDLSIDMYIVVWEREISATNHDILGQRFLSTGTLIGPLVSIATGSGNHTDPAVGSVNAAHRFLVTYTVPAFVPIAPAIAARAVNAIDGLQSSTVTVLTLLVGSTTVESDVGGNVSGLPGNYGAVVAGTGGSMVRAAGVTVPLAGNPVAGAMVTHVVSTGLVGGAAITKHGGASGRYLLTWDRLTGNGNRDLHARVIDALGNALSPVTTVSADLVADEGDADCASQDGTNFMVVYGYQATGPTGDTDVLCRMATFNFGLGTVTFSPASPVAGGTAENQVHPAVDFAASKYLVAWSAATASSSYDLYMQGFAPAGCLPCEPVVTIDASGSDDDFPALGAKYSGSFFGGDQAVLVWQSDSGTDTDVKAQRVEAIGAGGAVVDLGGGCGAGGTAGVSGPAAIGNAGFSFTLPIAAGLRTLVFGAATANLPCGPCTLVPNLDILIPAGPAGVAMPIPCDFALLGAVVKVQWIVVAPSPCPSFPFLSLSNALDVTIGT